MDCFLKHLHHLTFSSVVQKVSSFHILDIVISLFDYSCLVGEKCYLIVVWFVFPLCLMILNIFSCAFHDHLSALEKMCIWISCSFKNWVVYFLLSSNGSLCIICRGSLSHILIYKYFLPFCALAFFIFLKVSFECKVFRFWCRPVYLLFFGWLCFWCHKVFKFCCAFCCCYL